MVRACLADVNIEAHLEKLFRILEEPTQRGVWTTLRLSLLTFRDFDLNDETTDADLWRFCQERQLLLITANRNGEEGDCLEATIRANNTADCLPVCVVADAERIERSRGYTVRIVERLLEYLVAIDNYRGAGRLYLP